MITRSSARVARHNSNINSITGISNDSNAIGIHGSPQTQSGSSSPIPPALMPSHVAPSPTNINTIARHNSSNINFDSDDDDAMGGKTHSGTGSAASIAAATAAAAAGANGSGSSVGADCAAATAASVISPAEAMKRSCALVR